MDTEEGHTNIQTNNSLKIAVNWVVRPCDIVEV